MVRLRIIAAIGALLIVVSGWGVWKVNSSHPSRDGTRATEPPISSQNDITKYSHFDDPAMGQAQVGARIYDNWCAVCHGDAGQGLTAAWRAQWDPAHQDCWQSKCHGLNHPPDGFVIPRIVPGVVGGVALRDFESASALHTFIKAEMPFAEQGVLDDQSYWALTAYLLNQNGITSDSVQIGPDNGASIRLTR
jgi:cytochrome c5